MPDSREMTEQTNWQAKATITSVFHLKKKVLRNLRNYPPFMCKSPKCITNTCQYNFTTLTLELICVWESSAWEFYLGRWGSTVGLCGWGWGRWPQDRWSGYTWCCPSVARQNRHVQTLTASLQCLQEHVSRHARYFAITQTFNSKRIRKQLKSEKM